jgi:hypothetical protein
MVLALGVAVMNGGRAWLGDSYLAEAGKSLIAETQRAQRFAEVKQEAAVF